MDNMLRKIICRTCLTEASGYKSLLSKMDGDDRTVREVLTNFTNVDISVSDKYPKQVCDECYIMLFKADEFKKRCLQSETILKNGFLSHTFEELIKRELGSNTDLNVSNSYTNTQVTNNSYFDSSLKKNHSSTGEIEMAIVENYYHPIENFKNDQNLVKNEQDDSVHDDYDFTESTAIESTAIVEKTSNTGLSIRDTNSKEYDTSKMMQKPDSSKNQIALICTVCNEEFSNIELLQIHTLTHNDNVENYQCTICDTNFTCKLSLKSHIKTHKVKAKVKHKKRKNNENKNSLTLILTCPKCKEKFTVMESFQEHLKMHKEGNEESLVDNVKLNNEVQSYQCSLCMRKFERRLSLVTHIKRHEDKAQIKYPCKTCKREFQHKVIN